MKSINSAKSVLSGFVVSGKARLVLSIITIILFILAAGAPGAMGGIGD
jgi:hypothetical protein